MLHAIAFLTRSRISFETGDQEKERQRQKGPKRQRNKENERQGEKETENKMRYNKDRTWCKFVGRAFFFPNVHINNLVDLC